MSSRLKHLNALGNQVHVPLPKDAEGFIGRECPATGCLRYFKLKPGTGLPGENIPTHCPYCGHCGPSNTFYTPEQIAYGRSMVQRAVADAIHKDLKSMEFDTGPGPLRMTMKVTRSAATPIEHYREKALETLVTCDGCTLEYAIYGLFGYCPDCATHNSFQILTRNSELISKQLALAETVGDADLRRQLVEDALENCVSSFDGFGRETCRVRAPKSTNSAKCERIAFQNLNDAAARLRDLFSFDLVAAVDASAWATAHRGFMKRHVLAHRAGVVDAKYLSETSDSTSTLGRRVVVDPAEVADVSKAVLLIAEAIVKGLPPP